MESPQHALADAEAARSRLTDRVVVPVWFWAVLGAAIALQIATAAFGLADDRPALLVYGLAGFALVASAQLALLRRRSGVWLGGFASRVVLGTGHSASLVYAFALAAAVWAAFEGPAWLAVAVSVAGGAGYVIAGQRWLRDYRVEPDEHALGEPVLWLVGLGAMAVAGLVLLLLGS
jgi:hypothetical protein